MQKATFEFDLTLTPFADGGWYWYDVVAGDEDAVVESAEWTAEVPADRGPDAHGTVDIVITTVNKPDFCAKLLTQIGEDETLRPYLDTVFVSEQGTQKVADHDLFAGARKALGDLLVVNEQGNLGGSGGYARGQLESVRKGTATYAMMMDDDVVCEPEGIVRAITFGDLTRRPTIVGGHMFSLFSRSRLHSFGEIVQPWRFWWQTPLDGYSDWDLAARNIRSARWLHKRVDVDFNGWFMCLIPRVVLEQIGLSLPIFIKWDDLELGLRAKAAGFPTVTFPGAAVWHVPWTDKNDAVDWQAYFHHRNRLIAALLHSPYPHGGRLVRESLNHQIKHLVSLQYSTAELRHRAIQGVLAGPYQLHETLPTALSEVNAFRQAVDRRPAACRSRTPSRPYAAPSRPARARAPGSTSPAGSRSWSPPALAPIPPAAARAGAVEGVPRGGKTGRHGRQVVPPGDPTTPRSSPMNDGTVCRALPSRPAALPRAPAQDGRDPQRAAARVATPGRRDTALRWARSPRPRPGRRRWPPGWPAIDSTTIEHVPGGRATPTGRAAHGRARGRPGRRTPDLPGATRWVPRGPGAPLPAAPAGQARGHREIPRVLPRGWLWSYMPTR